MDTYIRDTYYIIVSFLKVDMASMEEVDEIARTPNHIPISCHMQ